MGRNSIGVTRINKALKLELSLFIKNGVIKKNIKDSMTVSFAGKSEIRAYYHQTSKSKYFELIYNVSNPHTGVSIPQHYKIYLTAVKSNLGNGEVLYFVCPTSGKRCRILYLVGGSHIFQARAAYPKRLYYTTQLHSKYNYWNERYWTEERKLEAIEPKSYKKTYRGKPTKKHLIIKQKRERLASYKQKSDNIFHWRIYNWRSSLFAQPKAYQQEIINSEDCLYFKYHLEGKKAII